MMIEFEDGNKDMRVRDFIDQYENMANLFNFGKISDERSRLKGTLEKVILSMRFYITSKVDEDSTEEDVMEISKHMMDMNFLEFCDEVNRDINLEVALNPDLNDA